LCDFVEFVGWQGIVFDICVKESKDDFGELGVEDRFEDISYFHEILKVVGKVELAVLEVLGIGLEHFDQLLLHLIKESINFDG
jgi:hypothetical protein